MKQADGPDANLNAVSRGPRNGVADVPVIAEPGSSNEPFVRR